MVPTKQKGEAGNYGTGKQKRGFQHFDKLFIPGTLKNVPCALNEPLVNFREESSGNGRFFRLEFRRMANWPSCDKKSESGRVGHPLEL